MLSLRDLQQQFALSIFAGPDLDAGLYVDNLGLSGARRFRVYRNNVYCNFTDALRADYPVVERLVGGEFFTHAARSYIERHPSHSGDLHGFGQALPEFLGALPSLVTLPYLHGVARLERACQEVYHAAVSPPLDLSALAAVSADDHLNLRLHLNGAARLLQSRYPILRIWQVNQPGYTGDPSVDLREGGVHLLVIRRELGVSIEPLTAGEYALLWALAKGRSLSLATELPFKIDPEFDLAAVLEKHVRLQTLVAFSIQRAVSHLKGAKQ